MPAVYSTALRRAQLVYCDGIVTFLTKGEKHNAFLKTTFNHIFDWQLLSCKKQKTRRATYYTYINMCLDMQAITFSAREAPVTSADVSCTKK